MRFPVVITPLLTGAAFFMLFAVGHKSWAAVPSLHEVIAGLDTTSPVLAEARLKLCGRAVGLYLKPGFAEPGFLCRAAEFA